MNRIDEDEIAVDDIELQENVQTQRVNLHTIGDGDNYPRIGNYATS